MVAAGLRSLGALLLCLSVLLVSGWSLRPGSSSSKEATEARAPAGALQEVAPPAPVQQLRARLQTREPQVRILAPADDTLVADGPWEADLEVRDWPLVDAGDLGPGTHLVVQLDDGAPLRVTSPETTSADGAVLRVRVPMPPLRPGSHRLTAYASHPWGEAAKAAGATAQIRIHRVAPNPSALPRPGTPQLISAIPSELISSEPVLIDWLLLNAPLQHLRDGDRRWQLRVTINGDSFLVDRQIPLWLRGLHDGGNAVQLELLDGLGEPLNPPFNSLVEEITLRPGDRLRWQRGPLTPVELDRYLGLAPVALEGPAPEEAIEPAPEPAPEASRDIEASQESEESEADTREPPDGSDREQDSLAEGAAEEGAVADGRMPEKVPDAPSIAPDTDLAAGSGA
jgi:hypothetical protein